MKKRILALVLALTMVAGLLCACEDDGVLSQTEAEKVAIEHFGLSESDVDEIYTHIATGDIPGYSIHITADGNEYSVLVDAATGECHESDH